MKRGRPCFDLLYPTRKASAIVNLRWNTLLRTKSKYGWAAGLVGAISLTVAGQPFTGVHQEAGYAEPGTCENCHAEIAANYRKTAMARSFYPAAAEEQGTYYHAPSDSYFSLIRRDGASYQRRYQLDSAARPVNVMEKRIDFVLGSGNHARTYLHRTERNTLVELPLAWYAEKGGSLAMNPGYDRPDHEGFRRAITYDCMFCHNAYPAAIPAGHEERFAEPVYAGSLPQGIDCQRCHGPGLKNAQLAKTAGAASAAVRAAILKMTCLKMSCNMCRRRRRRGRPPSASSLARRVVVTQQMRACALLLLRWRRLALPQRRWRAAWLRPKRRMLS